MGFSVGENGQILTTNDGGINWDISNLQTDQLLFDIYFPDEFNGWIVGNSGVILHTSDSGYSWEVQSSGTEKSLRTVHFRNSEEGWVVGNDGTILFTNDGGVSWNLEETIVSQNLRCLYATGEKVYASGINGVILQYSNQNSTVAISVNENWNMVSVPLLLQDMSSENVFPAAISNVFTFSNGYTSVDSLSNGRGYWVKFDSPGTIELIGQIPQGNIPLSAGWNIIGPFNESIDVAGIMTEPSGIITSEMFGFEGGYFISSVLVPGKAYWVKTSQAGEIIPGLRSTAKSGSLFLVEEDRVEIKITDASGNSSSLFIADEAKDSYELPPLPPKGVFDVRFADNKYLRSADEKSHFVEIQNPLYPVTIDLTGTEFRVKENKYIRKKDGDGNIYIMTEEGTCSFELLTEALPLSYSLEQNYPNPFNPCTTIKFGLPEDNRVRLDVYNILGERVAVLINDELHAGYHEVKFDASSMASGLYIYRISAGKHQAVKKMLLLK